MSRIVLPVKKDWKGKVKSLVVGLDHPLQHWFFQVYGPDDACGEPTFIEGDGYSGCSRGMLLNIIQKYADLDASGVKSIINSIADNEDPGDGYPGGYLDLSGPSVH